MGRPKPLLPFDSQTCLSLVLKACLSSRAEQVILVLGADAPLVEQEARARAAEHIPLRLNLVHNPLHERGQTSSLKCGLDALRGGTDAFALLPVDLPLVRSGDTDMLIDRFEAKPRGRTIFAATHEGRRGHPVLFAASHRAPILEMGDDEPLHSYIRVREGEIEQVPTDNPGVVADMNTPEEYQLVLTAFKALHGGGSAPRA